MIRWGGNMPKTGKMCIKYEHKIWETQLSKYATVSPTEQTSEQESSKVVFKKLW
jgi:hypothetical protein